MSFPFLLYKFLSNPRSEFSFSYLTTFYLYLHIFIKFSLLYLANLLLFICDSRSWLLSYVSLLNASVKFASLEFAVFLRVDIVSVACADISIILNLLIYTLAIQSVSSVDAILQ